MLAVAIMLCLLLSSGCGSEYKILLEEKTSAENDESSSTDPSSTDPSSIDLSWTEFNGLYWSEKNGTINRINLDGTGQEIIIESSNTPLDITFDTNNSMVFWAEYTGSSYRICRAGFNDDDTLIVYSSSSGPPAIAIDNSAGMIYWSDSSSRDIFRSTISSDILTGTEWFSDFANDHVYSVCIGSNGGVYFTINSYYNNSAALGDGNGGDAYWGLTADFNSDKQTTSLTGPTTNSCPFKGIAVDVAGNHVFYVTDTSNGTWPKNITRTDLSLSGSEIWVYLGPSDTRDIQKIALDLTNRKIYWTSQTDNRIYRADMDTQNPAIELFLQLESMPTGICLSQ